MALEHNVAAIWLSFGDNSSIAKWARFVREHETPGPRTLLFFQTASPSDARKAVEQWDFDVIVAQGHFTHSIYAIQSGLLNYPRPQDANRADMASRTRPL